MFGRRKLKQPPPLRPTRLERAHANELALGHIRTEDDRRWREEELAAIGRAHATALAKRADLPVAGTAAQCSKCGARDLQRELCTECLASESVRHVDWFGYVRGGGLFLGEVEVLRVSCRCGHVMGIERPLDADPAETGGASDGLG